MIETIEYGGVVYPKFQSTGNAAKYIMPFAKEVLKGDVIYDIGYGFEDWKFAGAIGIDVKDNTEFNAMNLPPLNSDGIFSSHLWEHLERPYEALDVWHNNLKKEGVLFMYLPNMDFQKYHRCWNNRKHLHYTNPDILRRYFEDNTNKWTNVFISDRDLYDSFCVIAEKI